MGVTGKIFLPMVLAISTFITLAWSQKRWWTCEPFKSKKRILVIMYPKVVNWNLGEVSQRIWYEEVNHSHSPLP
jgi:hypothetical protein